MSFSYHSIKFHHLLHSFMIFDTWRWSVLLSVRLGPRRPTILYSAHPLKISLFQMATVFSDLFRPTFAFLFQFYDTGYGVVTS